MKNTKKAANKLPVPGKVRKGFRFYCAAVLSVALVLGCSVTAFAANDPIAVVNNLSDFIFGLIRAVGLILLGWGIVQVGLSFQIPRSQPAQQRLSHPCGRHRHHLRQRDSEPDHGLKRRVNDTGATGQCRLRPAHYLPERRNETV